MEDFSCSCCYTERSNKGWFFYNTEIFCNDCNEILNKKCMCQECFKVYISIDCITTSNGFLCVYCIENKRKSKFPKKCLDCKKILTKRRYKKANGYICNNCYDKGDGTNFCCRCLALSSSNWYNADELKIKKICKKCYSKTYNNKKLSKISKT